MLQELWRNKVKKGPKGGKHEGVKEEGGHIRLSNFTCLIVSQMLPQYPNMRSFEWISTKWEPKRPREALIQPNLFSKFCVFQIWVFETNSAITQVLNTSMWCMSTSLQPHRASLKMSIVAAFGSSWFENYIIYKKCHVFFVTPCTIRGQGTGCVSVGSAKSPKFTFLSSG